MVNPSDSAICDWFNKPLLGLTLSCQHQLDAPECLLTGLPATVNQASPAKAAAKAASPAAGWALRALKQNSSKQTQMLEVLLKQHLQKQLLLTGNPVVVPVLGHQCVFRSPTLHCNIFCSARNATWMLSVLDCFYKCACLAIKLHAQ